MRFLCRADDIPEDDAREFRLDDTALVVVKKDGQLHPYVNWCPHLGIELNFQPDVFLDMDRAFIQCANHGALFEIDSGQCILGPCKGQALKAVPHELRDGELWVGDVPPIW